MRNIEYEENLLVQCDTFGQALSECKKTYTEADIEDMCCDWICYDPSIVFESDCPKTKRVFEAVATKNYKLLLQFDVDDDIWLHAIDIHTDAYLVCPNKSEEFAMRAIQTNPFAIQHIENSTYEMWMKVVGKSSYFFYHAPEHMKDEELCTFAVKSDGNAITSVPKSILTDDLIMLAVKTNAWAISLIDDLSLDMFLVSQEYFSDVIKHVKNQTYEMCISSINKRPDNILWINEQTEELCWLALKQDPRTILVIRKPTEDMLIYATNNIPISLFSEEVLKMIINVAPHLIKLIADRSEMLAWTVLEYDKNLIEYI